jgi:hypothetical protein
LHGQSANSCGYPHTTKRSFRFLGDSPLSIVSAYVYRPFLFPTLPPFHPSCGLYSHPRNFHVTSQHMLTPTISASKDGLSAIIQLPPGTHHIKFIVDGEMRTSDDLPTAVDYANILVNYLEVSADDIPPDGPSKPVNVLDSGHAGVHSSHAVTPAPGSKSKEQDADASKEKLQSAKPSAQAPPAPPRRYTKEIPKYLLDYDQPEDSPEYLRSAAAISNLPLPPSLPMFLSKVILNGTTPMKDDSSVLNIPNHVVLNHLATSSIKYNVLAVSATTRYKRKVSSPLLLKAYFPG